MLHLRYTMRLRRSQMLVSAMVRSRYRFPTVVLLISCQLRVGYSINDPSTVSNKLETEVVPKIIEWSKTEQSPLDLSTILRAQRIDAVCIVPDYNRIDKVGSNVISNVTNYHSSFEKSIPEGSFAIFLVKMDAEHAVLIHMNHMYFDISFDGKCVGANRAILKRSGESINRIPVMSLEDK